MPTFTYVAHNTFRIVTGNALVIFALSHTLGGLPIHGIQGDPFCLCSHRPSALHYAQVGLIIMAGVYIMVGIRTRVVAGFGAVFFASNLFFCDRGAQSFQMIELLVALMLIPLVLLMLVGGGAGAAYRKGWSGFKFWSGQTPP
ncbi:MAG: hypothetical protein AAF092_11975 [Pseudomonadota bacterium]